MDLLFYGIIVVGILIWLTLVFEALVGLRIIKFKGPAQWRIHRGIAYAIIGVGLLHGFAAVGHLLFGWF